MSVSTCTKVPCREIRRNVEGCTYHSTNDQCIPRLVIVYPLRDHIELLPPVPLVALLERDRRAFSEDRTLLNEIAGGGVDGEAAAIENLDGDGREGTGGSGVAFVDERLACADAGTLSAGASAGGEGHRDGSGGGEVHAGQNSGGQDGEGGGELHDDKQEIVDWR
jgi:hypothetical protein